MENQSSMILKKRKGDIKHSYADISNLKALGFVPKYTVETGLRITLILR